MKRIFKSGLDSEPEDSVSYAELSPNAFLSMPHPAPSSNPSHIGPDSGSSMPDSHQEVMSSRPKMNDESHFVTSEFLGGKIENSGYTRTVTDYKKPRICNPDLKGVQDQQQSIQSLDLLRKSSGVSLVPLETIGSSDHLIGHQYMTSVEKMHVNAAGVKYENSQECFNGETSNFIQGFEYGDFDETFYEVMDCATGFNATHAVATSAKDLECYPKLAGTRTENPILGTAVQLVRVGDNLRSSNSGPHIISGSRIENNPMCSPHTPIVTVALTTGGICESCGKLCQCAAEAEKQQKNVAMSKKMYETSSSNSSSYTVCPEVEADEKQSFVTSSQAAAVDQSSAESPHQESKSDQNPAPIVINGRIIECVVCGDKSSGKHYGQFTCEG